MFSTAAAAGHSHGREILADGDPRLATRLAPGSRLSLGDQNRGHIATSERLEALEQSSLLVVVEHVGEVVAGGALPGATRCDEAAATAGLVARLPRQGGDCGGGANRERPCAARVASGHAHHHGARNAAGDPAGGARVRAWLSFPQETDLQREGMGETVMPRKDAVPRLPVIDIHGL